MKKKLMAAALCGALAVSMSGAALAAPNAYEKPEGINKRTVANSKAESNAFTGDSATDTGEVKLSVTKSSDTDVYYVVVDWDSLTFSYSFGSRTWNPEYHKWVSDTDNGPGWVGDKNSATIQVANHSSKDVSCTAAYTAADTTSINTTGATATLSDSGKALTLKAPTEAATGNDNAFTDDGMGNYHDYTLTLKAPSANADASNVVVGTITVTISKSTTGATDPNNSGTGDEAGGTQPDNEDEGADPTDEEGGAA